MRLRFVRSGCIRNGMRNERVAIARGCVCAAWLRLAVLLCAASLRRESGDRLRFGECCANAQTFSEVWVDAGAPPACGGAPCGANSSCACLSLKDGLASAAAGATVRIAPGYYDEPSTLWITNSLSVLGDLGAPVLLSPRVQFRVKDDDHEDFVVLSGLVAAGRNAGGSDGSVLPVIRVDGGPRLIRIESCSFRNISMGKERILWIGGALTDVEVRNCTFEDLPVDVPSGSTPAGIDIVSMSDSADWESGNVSIRVLENTFRNISLPQQLPVESGRVMQLTLNQNSTAAELRIVGNRFEAVDGARIDHRPMCAVIVGGQSSFGVLVRVLRNEVVNCSEFEHFSFLFSAPQQCKLEFGDMAIDRLRGLLVWVRAFDIGTLHVVLRNFSIATEEFGALIGTHFFYEIHCIVELTDGLVKPVSSLLDGIPIIIGQKEHLVVVDVDPVSVATLVMERVTFEGLLLTGDAGTGGSLVSASTCCETEYSRERLKVLHMQLQHFLFVDVCFRDISAPASLIAPINLVQTFMDRQNVSVANFVALNLGPQDGGVEVEDVRVRSIFEFASGSEEYGLTFSKNFYSFTAMDIRNCWTYAGALNILSKSRSMDVEMHLERCNFAGNHAALHSGAVYLSLLRLGGFNPFWVSVFDCEFANNSVGSGGGALRIEGSVDGTLLIRNSFFYNNSGTDGGAVSASLTLIGPGYVTANFSSCDFFGNSAVRGGAIYLGERGMVLALRNLSIVSNSAASVAAGAYVSSSVLERCELSGLLFEALVAPDAAALYLSAQVLCTDIVLRNNFWNFSGSSGELAVFSVPRPIESVADVIECPVGAEFENSLQNTADGLEKRVLACSLCTDAFYMFEAGGTEVDARIHCKKCPAFSVCYGGDIMSPTPGYFLSKFHNKDVAEELVAEARECPEDYCCETESTCLADSSRCERWRDGFLCGKCKSGYCHSLEADCVACSSCRAAPFFSSALVAAFLYVCFVIAFPGSSGTFKVASYFLQMAPVVAFSSKEFERFLEIPAISAFRVASALFSLELLANVGGPSCPFQNMSMQGTLAFAFVGPCVYFFFFSCIFVVHFGVGVRFSFLLWSMRLVGRGLRGIIHAAKVAITVLTAKPNHDRPGDSSSGEFDELDAVAGSVSSLSSEASRELLSGDSEVASDSIPTESRALFGNSSVEEDEAPVLVLQAQGTENMILGLNSERCTAGVPMWEQRSKSTSGGKRSSLWTADDSSELSSVSSDGSQMSDRAKMSAVAVGTTEHVAKDDSSSTEPTGGVSFAFWKWKWRWSRRYVLAFVTLVLLAYRTIVETTLRLLNCAKYQTGDSEELRLFEAGEMACWTWWQILLLIALVTLIAPFPFYLLLYRWSCQIWYHGRCVGRKNAAALEVLENCFKPSRRWWESVLLFRRLLLLMLSVFEKNASMRALWISLACSLALVTHVVFLPFCERGAQTLETASLSFLLVLALLKLRGVSLLFSGYDDRESVLKDPVRTEFSFVVVLGAMTVAIVLFLYGRRLLVSSWRSWRRGWRLITTRQRFRTAAQAKV